MSYTIIIPKDETVLIDGFVAKPVDMSSVDPQIHAIQFNSDEEKGTIEYEPDSPGGIIPPLVEIESIEPWENVVQDAEEIIFCALHPKIFYSTVNPVGRAVPVTSKGWPQPENTTEKVPPTDKPNPNAKLYWDGSDFVWSLFPLDFNLTEAQAFVKSMVDSQAYSLLQPSDWLAVRKVESGVEIPEEWVLWRADVRVSAQNKKDEIEGCNDLEDLSIYCESDSFINWPPSP
jgi:hypothetical protein